MQMIIQMMWSSLNHGMLEDASCHAVFAGNIDSLQAIINEGVRIEDVKCKIDKPLSGMDTRCSSDENTCKCSRYLGEGNLQSIQYFVDGISCSERRINMSEFSH